MPNVGKIVKGVAKAVTKKKVKATVSTAAKKVAAKKDAAASARGLKAANKGSKAPKGYKPDTERRKALMDLRSMPGGFDPKRYYIEGAKDRATLAKFQADAPKNVVSRSGRKAK